MTEKRSRAPDRLLTIDDVSEICQVSTKTVRRHIEAKLLIAHRIGRQIRIDPRDLNLYLRDCRGR